MKILLTSHQFLPKYSSGTEILTRDTGLEMLRRGHEVHVLTVDPAAKGGGANVKHEDYDHLGLKVRALGLPGRRSAKQAIRDEHDNRLVAEHVRRYVRRVKPDAIHMFSVARMSGAAIDVFKEVGVPLVFTPTNFWPICARSTLMKPSGELSTGPDEISSNCLECRGAERFVPDGASPDVADKKAFYRELAERALAREEGEHANMGLVREALSRTGFLRDRFNSVDAILAPTELMRHMLSSNGIDSDLIGLSPYGIDLSQFFAARRNGRRGERRDGLRFGYVGTVHEHKGLHVLLEAFGRLSDENGATLRVCGGLSMFPDYARKVYAMAEDDPRVNFAGSFPNERMAEELGRIDVLIVPSTWYENGPLVVYSALAAGIPVVASDFGGLSEIVEHEKNGLLFKPGDPADLSRQLERLCADPNLVARLGENAGTLMRTVEDSVDEMLQLYERLAREKDHVREQPTEGSRSAKVSEHWARNVEERRKGNYAGNWLDHESIQRLYINPMSTGSGKETWFPYIARTYFPEKAGKALSLGCGGGALERHALSLEICEGFDAYDISEGSVEAAREEAQKAGIAERVNYAAADLNRLSLPENAYDAAFASMAIHHLENLEGVFAELTKALKPGGLFVFNEFVGPTQFQWTDRQLQLANELLESIPEEYRVASSGNILKVVRRPTIEQMNASDPSESIRSEEIMPVAQRFFDVVERREYGGTLLHLVTAAGTIRNYSPAREEDEKLLQRMIDFEQRHIAAGDIGSDFVLVVARNS